MASIHINLHVIDSYRTVLLLGKLVLFFDRELEILEGAPAIGQHTDLSQ